ncbi:hypothetical protein A3I56_00315 [Candidatus Roizmanbacteria bacterium RIFCSPLOWO2_02_FULL_43_10]|uniref:Chromosomal replication initiator DnaA C-terminal domain-containing protein n=3 Tax=Candidatus Roizmaniibacteriota TaxID=1752723 RepID=A0A1F7JU76_9BACT|nr:MAG: hypothetical protein A3D08_00650 [Candidatus Roizmanbacteria bacterium RIFCSPHIGHO2_02_FULL_43_11]OGK38657.1 MAG: hypothetical protein A3F32_02525 [Candidatus Roizmanbacteria bacterium RIFCSPHIGHO2_12_FULL_42_10]OGK59166.1 MAG: hypothetical protein A3I56_00315 [Candidatus Roizmanbacteria bacterium RIFCSPLOWO2_02_FULL_43_10]
MCRSSHVRFIRAYPQEEETVKIRKQRAALDRIIATVADYYRLDTSEILGHSRTQRRVEARQIVMWLMRTRSTASFPEIGVLMDRHHSTILHGCAKIERLIKRDAELREDLRRIQVRLDSQLMK